jgi:hypothetical protein
VSRAAIAAGVRLPRLECGLTAHRHAQLTRVLPNAEGYRQSDRRDWGSDEKLEKPLLERAIGVI